MLYLAENFYFSEAAATPHFYSEFNDSKGEIPTFTARDPDEAPRREEEREKKKRTKKKKSKKKTKSLDADQKKLLADNSDDPGSNKKKKRNKHRSLADAQPKGTESGEQRTNKKEKKKKKAGKKKKKKSKEDLLLEGQEGEGDNPLGIQKRKKQRCAFCNKKFAEDNNPGGQCVHSGSWHSDFKNDCSKVGYFPLFVLCFPLFVLSV